MHKFHNARSVANFVTGFSWLFFNISEKWSAGSSQGDDEETTTYSSNKLSGEKCTFCKEIICITRSRQNPLERNAYISKINSSIYKLPNLPHRLYLLASFPFTSMFSPTTQSLGKATKKIAQKGRYLPGQTTKTKILLKWIIYIIDDRWLKGPKKLAARSLQSTNFT